MCPEYGDAISWGLITIAAAAWCGWAVGNDMEIPFVDEAVPNGADWLTPVCEDDTCGTRIPAGPFD